MVKGLKESLENKLYYFYKVTFGSSYISFAIQTLESSGKGIRQKIILNKKRKSQNLIALDIKAQNQVLKRLREERLKVLLS